MHRLLQGHRRLAARLARRAPVLDHPAPPIAGGVGILPFRLPPVGHDCGVPVPVEGLGAAAAALPWWQLDPAAVRPEDRAVHRTGWAARLAWQAAAGVPGAGPAAVAGLSSWLEADRPGHGAGWVHTTDLVARLIHWLAALAWLGPHASADLRDRLAGSAALHVEHLERRLSSAAPGDPRRVLQLAGLAVGALGWPCLPRASERSGRALAQLGPALSWLLDADGAPRGGDLGLLPELLTHGLVVHAFGLANRAPLPSAGLGALRRALHLVSAVVGPGDGRVPGEHDQRPEPLLPLDASSRARSLWNAALGLGLVRGRPFAACGSLERALAPAMPARSRDAQAEGSTPSVRSFRAAGLVLGSSTVVERPSRLLVRLQAASGVPGRSPAALTVSWFVGGTPILVSPHPERHPPGAPDNVAHEVPARPPRRAEMLGARVTDKELLIRARAVGSGFGDHERCVRLLGRRLEVCDRFSSRRFCATRGSGVLVAWQLGPDWLLGWRGGRLLGIAGDLRLRIELDPALTWTLLHGDDQPRGGWAVGRHGTPVAAPMLLGRGPLTGVDRICCQFTLA